VDEAKLREVEEQALRTKAGLSGVGPRDFLQIEGEVYGRQNAQMLTLIAEVRRQRDTLERYGNHLASCARPESCTCGYSEAMGWDD
jgi:hypothetical protein